MEPLFESVHTDEDSSFRCFQYDCNSFGENHGWHYHPEHELTWIIAGRGMRFVGDSILPYAPGDLVLVGPNLPHCWRDEPSPGTRSRAVVAQFGTDCFGKDFLNRTPAQRLQQFLVRARQGVSFGRATAEKIGPLMLAMSEAEGLRRLARLLDVLEDLIGAKDRRMLASSQYQLNNDVAPASQARIELVHRYVRDNLGGDIREAEIASRIGMSVSAFSRFFHSATGHTFVAFVNIMRVAEACRLLSGTDKAITTIAMECGYSNISNFNRQFLARRGVNPTEYRRRVQQRDRSQRGGR